MAIQDANTPASELTKLLDDLSILASAYESFRLMAYQEEPHSHVPTVLDQLNRRLHYIVGRLDDLGMIS